ncbi:hypothetical protein DERF_000197 [Dermatophagoides farinae]|uniref:Uncharacterized protein n=1 Tax=Dermatophagoides farinae TaxID=6954 RepID=A0A922I9N1_DERFA|nr:hypothetical protein DERF_000197 [Dermatophagoides farinae]
MQIMKNFIGIPSATLLAISPTPSTVLLTASCTDSATSPAASFTLSAASDTAFLACSIDDSASVGLPLINKAIHKTTTMVIIIIMRFIFYCFGDDFCL